MDIFVSKSDYMDACRIILGLMAATAGITLRAEESGRPNIILFMVDDMGWQDTSLPFGPEPTPLNARYRTPNMERLAGMGMKFTQAYACAISSPSRCSLMTGMNQARHRVTNWTKDRDRMTDDPLDDMTVPDWNYNGIQPVDGIDNSVAVTPLPAILRDNGYHTVHVGKAHFGAFGTPSADPLNMGFDVNIGGTAAGGPAAGGYLGINRFGHDRDGNPVSSYACPDLEAYWDKDVFLTEALTREAIASIDSLCGSGRPFYLYMSHYAVHVPFCADDRFIDNYSSLDGTEREYAALIEGMDKSLGDIIDYLEDTGQIDNTIIIFMSDNGGLDFYSRGLLPDEAGDRHNYPLRSGKGSVYEGGVREPMIVYWKGVAQPGSTSGEYVIIEDFFPSILEMAGISDYRTLQTVDGVSFVPLIKGTGNPAANRALYWNTPNNWTNMIGEKRKRELGIGPTAAVRKGDYKLIYWYKDGVKELYDIRNDIGETNDIASRHPDIVGELSAELGAFLRSVGAQRPCAKSDSEECAPLAWPDFRE